MSDQTNSLADGGVPDDFWSVPESFIKDENLRLLHSIVCARLRQENPDADTLELMAIERVTSLFFYMRDRESAGAMGRDQAYKAMMQLWVTMAADLRKTRIGVADESKIREGIYADVVRGIKNAVRGMEPEVAQTVRKRLVESIGASGS